MNKITSGKKTFLCYDILMYRTSWLFFFMALFLSNLYSQDSPFEKDSRLLLTGFILPENKVYLEELPLQTDGNYPIRFTEQKDCWVLLFLSSLDPLLDEQKIRFAEFSDGISGQNVKTEWIVNSESISNQWTMRLLGLEELPAVVIIQKDGQITALMEGNVPDWQDENLQLFINELE